MNLAGHKSLKRYEGKRFGNVFIFKDANILTMENVYFPPSHKKYTKGVYLKKSEQSNYLARYFLSTLTNLKMKVLYQYHFHLEEITGIFFHIDGNVALNSSKQPDKFLYGDTWK